MKPSIHAPPAGCDPTFTPVILKNLSPSIHAPPAGCDMQNHPTFTPVIFLQSTHPLRGATLPCYNSSRVKSLQSTHPLRGATAPASAFLLSPNPSIHAPPAGCDDEAGTTYDDESLQPSIHAPPAGCDISAYTAHRSFYNPSIHAPPAGCDSNNW